MYSITHPACILSITHSLSLLDAPGTEACASEFQNYFKIILSHM